MDGHLPYLGWSPTNPRMITHQSEVHYRLGIWYLFLSMLCDVPTPIIFSLRTSSKALKGSWKSYLAFYTVISSPSTSDISTSEFSLTKSSSSTSWGKPANPWIKVVFNSAISMNILSCGIKLHRFQQHFRLLRTSTCLRQFQVLVKDYLHDLFHLHCIIF